MKLLRELMDLTGRVAIQAGPGTWTGDGDALAELSASIVVLDLDRGAASRPRTRSHPDADVAVGGRSRQRADVRRAEQIAAAFGRLDVLINNAALIGTSALN
jgi:NAD(P)-dependent dehydrogenase (short-subunit alcohol dehydrogenase family)